MFNIGRKKKTILVSAVVVMAASGVAFAYWTSGGSGTGSAETGDTEPVVVEQVSVVSDLRPGGAPQPLSGRFDNPNDGPVFIGSVVVSIDRVSKAAGAVGDCDADDYRLVDPTMTVNRQVAAGDDQGSWSGATIAFENLADVNQDGCKGATVELAYTAN